MSQLGVQTKHFSARLWLRWLVEYGDQ